MALNHTGCLCEYRSDITQQTVNEAPKSCESDWRKAHNPIDRAAESNEARKYEWLCRRLNDGSALSVSGGLLAPRMMGMYASAYSRERRTVPYSLRLKMADLLASPLRNVCRRVLQAWSDERTMHVGSGLFNATSMITGTGIGSRDHEKRTRIYVSLI